MHAVFISLRQIAFLRGRAALLITLLFLPLATYAGNMGSSSDGAQGDVQKELVRRQEDLMLANKLVAQGDQAMKDKDFETAYSKYQQALDLIGSGPINKALRDQALAKFSAADIAYAEKLINDGKYHEAEKVAKTVLLPRYNPTYKPAIELLSNLEQPNYYNKTVTPQFAADREEVKRLLVEAEGFYSAGQYDHAMKRYEQVLNIDAYNIAARKGEEQISLAKTHYDQEAYNEARSRLLWQVNQGWAEPVRKSAGEKNTDLHKLNYDSGTAKITAKLSRIIIPKVDLHDVTIREAVDFLRKQSKVLDSEDDGAKKGVNILLKLPQPSVSSATTSAPTGATNQPGATLPGVPGAAPGTLPPNIPAPAAPVVSGAAPSTSPTENAGAMVTEDTQITLSLTNIPLYEALKYLARAADMKLKIEPYAVEIVPLTEPTESLVTRTFKVPAGFIPAQTTPDTGGAAPFAQPGRQSTTDNTPKITGRANAKEYLESQQIPFPPGASAIYNPSNSTLNVRNTPTNIDVIEVIVDEAWRGAPNQIQIESKFVEVNQENLKELGFDWLLGPFSINGSGAYGNGGTAGAGQTVSSGDYPILTPGGAPVGQNPLTGGIRTGAQAITPSSIEGVIAQQSAALAGGSASPGPGIFSIAGVFSNPQFQVVIRALNQKKGVDLMSAPMVTTKSGQKATIHVVQEFIYPSQFTPPQIPQNTGGGGGTGTAVPFVSSATITPTTPSQFVKKNTGVSLDVEPILANDGFTIDLNLTPEVIDFDGFINYGSPILGITTQNFVPQTTILSPNVINQPIFSTRKVNTSVSIYDGQTVALGGLIREDVQKVEDKVPLLGDIPFAGRLFRSNVDQKTKRNLIIFVTAHVVDASGNFLRNPEDEEDVVTPVGVPEDLPKPHFPATLQGK